VPPDQLMTAARGIAGMAAGLDMTAHAASKLRARADSLQAIRDGITADRKVLDTPRAR